MRLMGIARTLIYLLAIVTPPCGFTAAQSQTSVSTPSPASNPEPAQFMHTAAEAMSLTGQEMKPWHLKAQYVDFGRDGALPRWGVVEEWWAGPEKFKIHYTHPGFDQTVYRVGKDTFLKGDGQWPQVLDFRASRLLLHPLPPAATLDGVIFTKKDVPAGDAKLKCLTATPKGPTTLQTPIPQVFCFVGPLPILRVEEDPPAERTSFNSISRLNGHYLAQKIRSVDANDSPIFTVDVSLAEPLPAVVDEAAFTPPSDAKLAPPWDADFTGFTEGHLIAQTKPQYPEEARIAGVQGTVDMRGVIGKDGTFKNLVVVSGPVLLQRAALEAGHTGATLPISSVESLWRSRLKSGSFSP